MIPVEDLNDIKTLAGHKFIEYVGDFFDISENDVSLENINVVISHETIHCFNDSRYGNKRNTFLSYSFAEKLVKICPNLKVVIVSTIVGENDSLIDNNTILSDKKIINSFIENGFALKEAIYDKYRTLDSISLSPDEDRITYSFPKIYCEKAGFVVATYLFLR